jgi:hypothetical protein
MLKRIICQLLPAIFTLLLSGSLRAQEPVKTEQGVSSLLEDQIEQLSGNTDTEADYSDLVEELLQYIKNPVNINTASEQELHQLQLNDLQINNLSNYILTFGELTSLYELNLIEGFDSTLVADLSPFITFKLSPFARNPSLKNLATYGKESIILRYQQVPEEQKGYTPIDDSSLAANPNSRYLGGPEKLYLRLGYNFYNSVRFGATMEKDPGETLFPDSDTLKKGFDFYSFHFFYAGKKFVKSLAIGDYHVQFGQGLTLWSSMAFGKSPSGIPGRRMAPALKPNTGANENLFMRGVATTISPLRNLDLTLFYSSKLADANTEAADSLSAEEYYISSLLETGYHRTPGELAGKDAIRQTHYGGNLQTRIRMFRFGASVLHSGLDNNLQKDNALYRQFEFNGKALTNAGFDYAVILRSFTLYGEFSGSDNGGKAVIAGANFTPDPRLALSAIYRNYSKNYQNLMSNAFGENSKNSNEKGLYIGMLAQLHRRLGLTAFADHFSFPWLKYRVDAPSRGSEYTARLTYTPSRRTEIQLQYRVQQKQLNPSDADTYTTFPETESRQNFRISFNVKPTAALILKSRVESIVYRMEGSGRKLGFLAYQEVAYRNQDKPWQLTGRYAIFDTDSYNERLYAYESDVLYAFSIPSYYYKGSRFYLLGRYSFGRSLDLWVRYSITHYSNKQVIGSGLDEIDGNNKSEIKLQLRYRF